MDVVIVKAFKAKLGSGPRALPSVPHLLQRLSQSQLGTLGAAGVLA